MTTERYLLTKLRTLTAFILIVISTSNYAFDNQKNIGVVNLLTWWGYLNNPELINKAQKKCGVKISYDQYYSNAEFLRRYREHKDQYDVIIFSNTIYGNIKNEIPNIPSSKLWLKSKQYNRVIQKHYARQKYPKNIAYFMHSLSGFLYNTDELNLSNDDTLDAIFSKSAGRIVVIMDDAIEINKLLNLAYGDVSAGRVTNVNKIKINEYFEQLNKKIYLYIGNGFDEIYQRNDFAFAFMWSGEGIKKLHPTNGKLKYFIHPNISYISSDLIGQNNDASGSKCVADYLSGKEALSIVENNNYYFSPYTEINKIADVEYRYIYSQFLDLLPHMFWIDEIPPSQFNDINKSWDIVKLRLISHGFNGSYVEHKFS